MTRSMFLRSTGSRSMTRRQHKGKEVEWDNIKRTVITRSSKTWVLGAGLCYFGCSDCQGLLDLSFGDKFLCLYDCSLFPLDWVVCLCHVYCNAMCLSCVQIVCVPSALSWGFILSPPCRGSHIHMEYCRQHPSRHVCLAFLWPSSVQWEQAISLHFLSLVLSSCHTSATCTPFCLLLPSKYPCYNCNFP